MKAKIFTLSNCAGLLFVFKTGISQNAGVNTDGSAPETGVMLDVKGTNAKASTALQNIFQIKSADASTDALKLRLGLQTHATPGSRYGVIDVPEYVGNSITAYRPLALQPLGGNVGIGTSNPSALLHLSFSSTDMTYQLSQGLRITNSSTVDGTYSNIKFAGYDLAGTQIFGGMIGTMITSHAIGGVSGDMFFHTTVNTGSVERIRITSNGFVGIGTSVPEGILHVATMNNANPRGIINQQSTNDNNSAFLQLRKSRGTIVAPLAVQNGDALGSVLSEAYDGTSFIRTGGMIKFTANGAISAGSIPTDIIFYTGSSGLGSQRFRITSAGFFEIQLTSLPIYGTNLAATSGGLTTGMLYRTGGDPDVICVVH